MAVLDCPAAQDELIGYAPRFDAPFEDERTKTADPAADGHLAGAARGILLAAGLGSFFWAGVLWALL